MPPRRPGFRYPRGIADLFGQPPRARPSGLVIPPVVPARIRGAYAPGKMGWGPQVRPIASPPIQAYQRQVQTYIGGYGVAQTAIGGQIASATTTSLTTLTITLATPTTAGHCLVLCCGATAATDSPTISAVTIGGSADNWVAAISEYAGGANPSAAIWIDPNCKGGQTSVVVTFTGGSGTPNGAAAYVFEVPNIVMSSPLDQTAGSTVTGSGVTSSALFTSSLTAIPEIAFAVIAIANATTLITGPALPWTSAGPALTVSTNVNVGAYWQAVTTTSPLSLAASYSAAAVPAIGIATLKGTSVSNPMLGQGIVSLGPAGFGTRWYPNQVNVATALGAADTATAAGYLNIVGQGGFLFQSYAGGGDQVGLAVPEILPGNLLYVLWSGSKPGIQAQAVILGTQSVLSV